MFRLNKWYMDCVAPDGTAVVAYWAKLAWGVVRFRCAAVLVRRQGTVSEAATLCPGRGPTPAPGGIAWWCGRLRLEGHWQALDPPVRRTLLASDKGNVDWLCLLPRAGGRVHVGGVAIEGLGYVERLDMTLRPWDLPIRELRWGRFLSEGAAVVWIEWRGAQPLTLLCVNGSEATGVEVGDAGVAWRGGGRVELDSGTVLRDGALGTTALTRVPLLAWLAPRAVREMYECKWLRRGRLVGGGGGETGWAIDEVVRFGGPGG